VCTEASIVLTAVAADFFFNCWCSEIRLDNHIQHEQRCVQYHVQTLKLEAFYDLYVGSGRRTPEFYSISPDWFVYCFIYEKLLLTESFDLNPSNQYILVRVIHRSFLFEKIFVPGKSPVSFYLEQLYEVYMDQGQIFLCVLNVTWICFPLFSSL
jgi:hypothetical protein